MPIVFGSAEANRILEESRRLERLKRMSWQEDEILDEEDEEDDSPSNRTFSVTFGRGGAVSLQAEGRGFLPAELVNALLGKSA